MPTLSPQPRSNNNQQKVQKKMTSTNHTQPAKNTEWSFGGRVRKSVNKKGEEHVTGQTKGLPEVKGRGWGLSKE
jgi:hypothetical protein